MKLDPDDILYYWLSALALGITALWVLVVVWLCMAFRG
jgi:hypothetical protein